jgi:hypothetical protein
LAINVHNHPEQVGFRWRTRLDPRSVADTRFTHALGLLWRSQHALDLWFADLTARHLQPRMVNQAVRRDRSWVLGHASNLPSRSCGQQDLKLMVARTTAGGEPPPEAEARDERTQ